MPLGSHYPGYDTRLHTRDLWDRTDFENNLSNIGPNRNVFEDFLLWAPQPSTTATSDLSNDPHERYRVFVDRGTGAAGGAVLATPSLTSGGLRIGGTNGSGTLADNDAATVQYGNSPGFRFSQTAANARPMRFETRFRVSSIADAVGGLFIGLAQPGLTAATAGVLATDADAIASISCLGLLRSAADGDAMDLIYRDSAGAQTILAADWLTLVADTWYKFGWEFDPDYPTGERIRFWKDGVKTSTVATSANMAAATFPLNDDLVPTFAYKAGSTTVITADIDWFHCFQEPE